MAGKLSFRKGPFAKLPSSFSEGAIYITTDRHEMYVDVSSGSRVKISDISVVASKADLPKTKDQVTTKFYFVDEDNILATWSESAGAMVRVNPDVTSVKPSEVVGQKEGNAVTNITYDANKREIVFEKGLTFVTEEVIGSLENLSTKDKSNLVAAINEINQAMVEGTTGIKNMYIDEHNNLICELTNGTQINAGNIPSYKEISLINCGNANSAS